MQGDAVKTEDALREVFFVMFIYSEIGELLEGLGENERESGAV